MRSCMTTKQESWNQFLSRCWKRDVMKSSALAGRWKWRCCSKVQTEIAKVLNCCHRGHGREHSPGLKPHLSFVE
jgi:hypothetical protein